MKMNISQPALKASMVGVSLLLASAAQAMLPTPEPELDYPSNIQNANLVQQNTTQSVMSNITASVVERNASGNEVLVPIDANTRLQKGDVVEYQGHFTNTNSDRQKQMTVTLTIPPQVKLLEGYITPDKPYASIDGVQFNLMPLQGNFSGEIRPVALDFYKALRWNIEGLAPNATATVKYRAVVK